MNSFPLATVGLATDGTDVRIICKAHPRAK
jgi:hypothetical protein